MSDVKGINFNSLSLEQLNSANVTNEEKEQIISIFNKVDNEKKDEDKRKGFIAGEAISAFYTKLRSKFGKDKVIDLILKIRDTYKNDEEGTLQKVETDNYSSIFHDARKFSARENDINERANAVYSEDEISNITKNQAISSLLMQNNLVTRTEDGGYSIKNLSNYVRKFADLANNYSDKEDSMSPEFQSITPDIHRIQNLKNGLLSDYGIEITDKIAKELIKFCGYNISR